MQEALLHYVWLHQHFRKKELKTTGGLPINVIKQGYLNNDAGPDFSQAKVVIDEMEWNGSVEIHIKASDWNHHNHATDESYNNVILHVVWTADKEVLRYDDTKIPVLELKELIDPNLISKYEKLVTNQLGSIPCASQFRDVKEISKYAMLDGLVMERVQSKAKMADAILKANKHDWNQTAYELFMSSVGLKVNSLVFIELAKSLPYKLISKYNQSLFQLESLMFGMGGFLEKVATEYQKELYKEYKFLAHKHNLQRRIDVSQWKFMRLRPAAFPTLRIAQLATIFHKNQSLFTFLTEFDSGDDFRKKFSVKPTDYWCKHYNFGKPTTNDNGGLGSATLDIVIINAAVPLLVSYGKIIDDQRYIDKAVHLLESTKAEKNRITKIYDALELKPKSALDTQGMIQWYNEYCQKRRCLECSVGNEILRAT